MPNVADACLPARRAFKAGLSMAGALRATAPVRVVGLLCAIISVDGAYTCYSSSDSCTQTGPTNIALDCTTEGGGDDRDFRTVYLTGTTTITVTGCSFLYVWGSTSQISTSGCFSCNVGAGVTFTVSGASRIHLYKAGGVPPRGARTQPHYSLSLPSAPLLPWHGSVWL